MSKTNLFAKVEAPKTNRIPAPPYNGAHDNSADGKRLIVANFVQITGNEHLAILMLERQR